MLPTHRFLPVLTALAGIIVVACSPRQAAAPTIAPVPDLVTPAPTSGAVVSSTPEPSAEALAEPEATSFPDPQAYTWLPVANGLESPVDIQFPPDGSGRMFVVEQPGRIRIVDSGGLPGGTYLDIVDRVNSSGNEQGLLGLAFHPRYTENGQFFVNYTDYNNHNVIARFQVSPDPQVADRDSEKILVSIDDPYPNHNGGVLAFGPDGYLYAGLGDGGSANDPMGNGQNTNSLLGKVLRLDADGGDPYSIPGDNPFAAGGGRPEVWAYGLRNPWRISFDLLNGDLYIADVGQNAWEEVDFLPADSPGGANFGWSHREGSHTFEGREPAGTQLIDPVAEYSHSEGGCSITGGYVYRGSMPEWNGVYFYGDYCSGLMWGLLRSTDRSNAAWQSQLLYQTGANITTFGQDPAGELYFADRSGEIFRLSALP